MMTPETKSLILDLYSIEAIKFGSFTLKSGIQSPIYIDLRLVISYPPLMKKLSACLNKLIAQLSFDMICGIPYAALPITTALSLEGSHPMIMCRKEVKDYGTKKLIEGKFEKGQTCLLIEDVVTSGASIMETAASLRKQDLEINDAIVVLDREQGGKEKLMENSIVLHPLISIFELLKVLFYEKKISEATFKQVNDFLAVPAK
ncbi:MAG: orotate phosphoribosyltransferase [Verrucomicrobia bacterium]|nr:orotate phosphoribosyltransferase [Verrucomicrobiota bacterium]